MTFTDTWEKIEKFAEILEILSTLKEELLSTLVF